jgi:IS605 OrfB family transposase
LKKKSELNTILTEYGKVVNFFIEQFWSDLDNIPSKSKLLKPIVDLPSETWLSARLRKVAAREAIDMVLSTKQRWKTKSNKMVKPHHKGNRMYVSCTIADLVESKQSTNFDAWLHLASIGNKMILDLPIKYHKHFNKYNELGKRLNSYIITKDYVQFSFEIETGTKKEGLKCVGIDSGINALASTSNNNQYGLDIKDAIERVKRCKHGSNGQKQARRALKQRIDEIVIELFNKENPDLIVVEKLSKLGQNSKVKRLLTKNIRRSIGIWNWKYWLKRLEEYCELNRVSFRSVSPYYTSQTCPVCNRVDRGNRKGQIFMCQKCGYTGNVDINASINILNRFLTGVYGVRYKQENLIDFPSFSKFN